MSVVLVGTSTDAGATYRSTQRKLLKSSTGILVIFALVDGSIQYKTSTNDGQTWSANWTSVYTPSKVGVYFEATILSNDNIVLAIQDGNYVKAVSLKAIRFVYNAGVWTPDAAETVGTQDYFQEPVVISQKSNGNVFIVSYKLNSDAFYSYKSTDGGDTWGTAQTQGLSSSNFLSIEPYSTYLWLCLQRWSGNGTVNRFQHDSSWTAGSGIISNTVAAPFQLLNIDTTHFYLAGDTASGIKVYKFSGVAWDSGTLLSDHANDRDPTICNVGGVPVVLWSDYDGSDYHIVYRKWNGADWDAQVAISTVGTDYYPASLRYDASYIQCVFTSGSGSPYNIYFYTEQDFGYTSPFPAHRRM